MNDPKLEAAFRFKAQKAIEAIKDQALPDDVPAEMVKEYTSYTYALDGNTLVISSPRGTNRIDVYQAGIIAATLDCIRRERMTEDEWAATEVEAAR